jgi:hypothetical protein
MRCRLDRIERHRRPAVLPVAFPACPPFHPPRPSARLPRGTAARARCVR